MTPDLDFFLLHFLIFQRKPQRFVILNHNYDTGQYFIWESIFKEPTDKIDKIVLFYYYVYCIFGIYSNILMLLLNYCNTNIYCFLINST